MKILIDYKNKRCMPKETPQTRIAHREETRGTCLMINEAKRRKNISHWRRRAWLKDSARQHFYFILYVFRTEECLNVN